MKEGKELEGKTVKINLKNGFFYTVIITEETSNYLKGVDKFGEPVMFSMDSIKSIVPIHEKKEVEKNEPKNTSVSNEDIESVNSEKKEQGTCLNNINKTYQEQVRAIILELINSGMKKVEIGRKAGVTGEYVHMILNYKTWPKRIEYQLKLLKRFEGIKEEQQ